MAAGGAPASDGLEDFTPDQAQAVQSAYQTLGDPKASQDEIDSATRVKSLYIRATQGAQDPNNLTILATHRPIDIQTPQTDNPAAPDNLLSHAGISKTESALRGAAQGATVGAQAILSAGTEAGLGAMDSLTRGKNNFGDEGLFGGIKNIISNYRRARDTQNSQNTAASNANPKTYLGSAIVGGIPLAIATGGEGVMGMGVAGSELPMIQRTINAAQLAGAAGAISGFANSKGDLTKAIDDPSQGIKVGKDTLDSALIAGSMGPLLSGMLQSSQSSNPVLALQQKANDQAFKALRPIGQYATKLINDGRDQAIGQTLLDEGLIGPTTSRSTILDNVNNKLEEVGQKIGYFAKQADIARSRDSSIPGVSVSQLTNDISNQIVEPLSSDPSTMNIANDISKWTLNLKSKYGDGEIGFEQGQAFKKSINAMKAKFNSTGDSLSKDAYQQVYGILNTHIENGIDNAFTKAAPNLENDFVQSKQVYRNLSDAQNILDTSVAADAKNKSIGLTDILAGIGAVGAAGHDSGTFVKAGLMGGGVLANKAAGKYGNQVTASAFNGLAKALNATPAEVNEFLGKYGPNIKEAAARSAATVLSSKPGFFDSVLGSGSQPGFAEQILDFSNQPSLVTPQKRKQ